MAWLGFGGGGGGGSGFVVAVVLLSCSCFFVYNSHYLRKPKHEHLYLCSSDENAEHGVDGL